MKITSLLLRRIHKWIGLILGLQFVLWTLSGAMMSVLDHEVVAGGHAVTPRPIALPAASGWEQVRRSATGQEVTGFAVRPLLDRYVYEVATKNGVQLFDAASGAPLMVDAALARSVAEAAHPARGRAARVTALDELELAVREHSLPIWRVDFADGADRSFYVSAMTGRLLQRRNDTWRVWDFFWMLHNMDYVNRTSFNHPLIVTVGFGAVWLAVTGFWLLFRTAWRPDLRALRRRRVRRLDSDTVSKGRAA